MAIHEGAVHRVRSPRHIGRDGIVRPSTAHENKGFYILDVGFLKITLFDLSCLLYLLESQRKQTYQIR